MSFKQKLARTLLNIPGWRTHRKILVVESDDWGSIRMPSREVYKKCLSAGYPVDRRPYERYDSLASQDDLELLFDLLSRNKDSRGNPMVITANCVVANPNFEKIAADDFRHYHYELITDTFEQYGNHHAKNFELWQQGNKNGIFRPQFHAREHLNVSLFMNALQARDPDVHYGFAQKMPGIIDKEGVKGNLYVEATRYTSEADKQEKLEIYLDGLRIFREMFGYASTSIIPTNYTWSPDFNSEVATEGVRYLQGQRKFKTPDLPFGPIYKNNRFLGQTEKGGLLTLVRNVTFEPALLSKGDGVDTALSEISLAFRYKKPAIVSTHRLNFVGYIDTANRDRNLKNFETLLQQVVKKWPDVEFMSSDALGDLIAASKRKER